MLGFKYKHHLREVIVRTLFSTFIFLGVFLSNPAMANCRSRVNPFDFCRGEIVIISARRVGTVISLPQNGNVLVEINKQSSAARFPIAKGRQKTSNLATLRGCVTNDPSFCVGTRVITPEGGVEYIVGVFERDEVYTGPSVQIDVYSSRVQRQLTRYFTTDLEI